MNNHTRSFDGLARMIADALVPAGISVKCGTCSRRESGPEPDVMIEFFAGGGFFYGNGCVNDGQDQFRLMMFNVIEKYLRPNISHMHPTTDVLGYANFRTTTKRQHEQAVEELHEILGYWSVPSEIIKNVMDGLKSSWPSSSHSKA